MSAPLLEIKNLDVWFRVFQGNLKVLDGLNLTVGPGEKVGLVGEMGCGKTTTMKALMRLLPTPPAKIKGGEIYFKGRELLSMRTSDFQHVRRKEISMIFEDPTAALNPVFTIGTQLLDAARYSGIVGDRPSNRNLRKRVIQALEEVSLPDPERVLKNYPIQLSGGMRQRVCIAMALLGTNDLLIADEPDTSLDVTIKDQILRLLNSLVIQKGTSIILISHSLGAVRGMTDRLYVMYAGSIVESAKTKELFASPQHPYSQALIASTPRLTGGGIGEGIGGRIPEYLNPPQGCRFNPRCKFVMPVCREKKPPLFSVGGSHAVACFLYENQGAVH